MPIRLYDSGKFKDPWYRALSPKHKCIFEFALAECDCGGVFKIDLGAIAFHINDQVTETDLLPFKERFVYLKPDTVFIPKFIEWQYRRLNPALNPHKGAIRCLERAGIDWVTLTPLRPQEPPAAPTDRQGAARRTRFVKPSLEQIAAYCKERNNGINPQQFFYFYEAKGWHIGKDPMKDWQAAVRTWEKRQGERHGTDYNKQADVDKYEGLGRKF